MPTSLAQSLAAGDPQAFAALYDRLASRLVNTARTMTGSIADAEDTVHDLFVTLARGRDRLATVADLDAYVLFFAAAIPTSLFWTAACVAAAARTERIWLRRLLVAAGVLLPLLLFLPWVGLTGWLAFVLRTRTNWFAPTLTALLSAAIGGWWVFRAGMTRTDSGPDRVAAAWPAFGLAALYLAAEAVTWGTLVSIDHDVAAQGRALRAEAATLMAASMPPAPAPDDDAAPLLHTVFAALQADASLSSEKSPLSDPLAADVTAADVTALLARHATTLDMLRRAADKPGSRFLRDWSRTSLDMQFVEAPSMVRAAGLLAFATREKAVGDSAGALRDIERIHRLAMHTAAQAVLINGLMGDSIDNLAIETLAAVLPTTSRQDLSLLADTALTNFTDSTFSLPPYCLREDAWAMLILADLQQGLLGPGEMSDFGLVEDYRIRRTAAVLPAFIYRCFLWPADVAVYRRCVQFYQRLASDLTRPESRLVDCYRQERRFEDEIKQSREAFFGTELALPLVRFAVHCKSQALHRCAAVLVAATKFRLATGSLPETAAALVPDHLATVPLDPFMKDAPLRVQRTDDGGLMVYSVGPDGEDDGGPPPRGAERPQDNDDVGLRLAAGHDR